jgi:rubrerythrin
MAKKPFMEMDLEEFEDNNTVGDIDEPSLDFDFDTDKDTTGDSTENDVETPTSDDASIKPETENISDEYAKYLETVKRYKANPQEAINDLKEKVKPYTLPDDFVNGITTDLSKYDNAEISKDGKVIFCLEEFNNIARIICNYDELVLDKKLIDLGGDGWGNSLVLNLDNGSYGVYYHDRFKNGENITIQVASSFDELLSNLKTEESTESNETPEIPETPDFDNPDDTSTTTQEGYVQEGMFDAGFNNLRSKIAQALGEKFKVTNVVKGMGGKDKFDITEQDVEDPTKTTVESTGTACNVTVRGDGKIGRKIGITLSSALDKILEIVKKPDLVLESGFYNISRNVNGGFYQEADDETADDEDFGIDAELDELDLDDESTSDDDAKKDTDETSTEETKETDDTETEETETDIDLDSFGSDTSDVQNEYDQKDVDALNKLIAAESEAINDYFDASKDTRNEDLRTLFSDIGHEERFHLEQLMYSKSILTGEKYEPRDPDVKKEYEELISNGMDEDEAISTAVEKHRIDGGNIDLDEVEQEAAYIYDTLRNSEILTEYCCKAIEQKRVKNALMSAETKFVVEAFIQESLENVSQASKKDVKIKSPIDILIKGLTLSVKGIIRMGEVTRDALHKNNLKNARRKEWIKKHGIVELFRSGVALYFWNDKNNVYDINLACRYVDMLYRLSKDIGAKCGVRLTQDAQRKPIENPLKYSSIEDGINILRGVVLTKTKIVVNENNKDIIANTFFGYTPDKVGVAVTHGKDGKPVNDSANIYNRVDVALVLTKDYSEVSNAVLGALKRLEGDTNSVFYKNRALFDKSVSQMEFVVKKYQEFVSCLAHDLKVMTKLDNGMLQETRNRDEAEQNGGKK